jgi:hypothetical protein
MINSQPRAYGCTSREVDTKGYSDECMKNDVHSPQRRPNDGHSDPTAPLANTIRQYRNQRWLKECGVAILFVPVIIFVEV